MKEAMISAIQKFSIHDGPGIRTVVFFKGCPLCCPWCGNPETQNESREIMYTQALCIHCRSCENICPQKCVTFQNSPDGRNEFRLVREECTSCGQCAAACPTKAITLRGEGMTVERVMTAIRQDRAFYRKSGGGVTFSGGEPFLQSDFLLELAKTCKRENLHTAVETSGFVPWQKMESMLSFIDLFLYDLKIMDAERHGAVIGVSNRLITDNLRKLASAGSHIIIRVPIIPGFTDGEKNVEAIFSFAKELKIEEVNLLPFHNFGSKKYEQLDRTYEFAQKKAMQKEDLQELKEKYEGRGFHVKIGG